jgi:serine/threonine-protein kinase
MPDTQSNRAAGASPIIAGRYQLEQRTGEGALFDVARATDRESGRTVAVKILKSALAKDRRYAARLVAEAQATQVLTDSRIAHVLDAGQDGGTVCVIAEFVEGTSLRERIRRTAPMPVAVAVDLAVEIAGAVASAHAKGIVHGDLRPENVLITPDGDVKVTDFGLAHAIAASPDIQMNSVLRWVQCASPEAAAETPVTPASDVYSLGCILYEMLTGVAVFPGENAIVVALKHSKDAPRMVDVVNPSIPRSLAGVVMRCLEKNPGARYENADALLGALKQIQDASRYNKPLDFTPSQVLKPVTHIQRTEIPYEDEDELPRYQVIIRNIMLMLIGVGIVAICVFLRNVLTPPPSVSVPAVIGQSVDDARRTIEGLGLQVTVKELNNQRPAGEVLNQDPEPNATVKAPRQVMLVVSKGPKMAIVPPLTEMTYERAAELAAQAGLTPKKTVKYSDDVPKGNVIDQTPPAADQVLPGSTVKLTVSKGPEPPPPPAPVETLYPGAGAPPTDTTGAPAAPTGRQRSFKVSFQIPSSGYDEPVEVQLVVIDDRGENTIADEQHHLGEVVTKQVDTVGDRVRLRVYLNSKLYSEEIK